MTDLRALLAPIRERIQAANLGPIGYSISENRKWGLLLENSGSENERLVAKCVDDEEADLFANAPTDLTRLLAAIEAVIGEIVDTDLETNEAIQGDLADRILSVIAAALGSDTTNQEGTQ